MPLHGYSMELGHAGALARRSSVRRATGRHVARRAAPDVQRRRARDHAQQLLVAVRKGKVVAVAAGGLVIRRDEDVEDRDGHARLERVDVASVRFKADRRRLGRQRGLATWQSAEGALGGSAEAKAREAEVGGGALGALLCLARERVQLARLNRLGKVVTPHTQRAVEHLRGWG